MPILRRLPLNHQPRLLQRLHYFLRQFTLLQILKIPLEMLHTTRTNNNRIS